jgi:folylpolyglutamate synthase/dihydropteroate synthase
VGDHTNQNTSNQLLQKSLQTSRKQSKHITFFILTNNEWCGSTQDSRKTKWTQWNVRTLPVERKNHLSEMKGMKTSPEHTQQPHIGTGLSNAGQHGRTERVNQDFLFNKRVEQEGHAVLRAKVFQQRNVRSAS